LNAGLLKDGTGCFMDFIAAGRSQKERPRHVPVPLEKIICDIPQKAFFALILTNKATVIQFSKRRKTAPPIPARFQKELAFL
jgi:hypothetical protein